MYGGGFATIPAFLADMFGEGIGSDSRRHLTAWSAAAIAGRSAIITEPSSRRQGAPGSWRKAQFISTTNPLKVLAGLLAVAFVLHPVGAADLQLAQIAQPARALSSLSLLVSMAPRHAPFHDTTSPKKCTRRNRADPDGGIRHLPRHRLLRLRFRARAYFRKASLPLRTER